MPVSGRNVPENMLLRGGEPPLLPQGRERSRWAPREAPPRALNRVRIGSRTIIVASARSPDALHPGVGLEVFEHHLSDDQPADPALGGGGLGGGHVHPERA